MTIIQKETPSRPSVRRGPWKPPSVNSAEGIGTGLCLQNRLVREDSGERNLLHRKRMRKVKMETDVKNSKKIGCWLDVPYKRGKR